MIKTIKNGLITALIFVVDMMSLIQDTGQQIDWDYAGVARFHAGGFTVQANGAVTAADVVMTVDPLTQPLKAGAVIDFGSGDKIVLVADSPVGDTTLNINPAQSSIADNTVGYAIRQGYESDGFVIPAGTAMCRNTSNHKLIPRAVHPGSEAAECIILTEAKSNSYTDSLTGYGVTYGGIMYENLLPDFTNAAWSTFKTELGARFVWKTYRDSRGE